MKPGKMGGPQELDFLLPVVGLEQCSTLFVLNPGKEGFNVLFKCN